MNFYTVASKMLKNAEKAKMQTTTFLEHNSNMDPDTIKEKAEEAYDNCINSELAKFDKTCDLGVDLMTRFSSKIKTINDNNGERWYFITVRPPHNTEWEKFKKDCESYCDKWAHKWLECTYVYEQKGEDSTNIGHGFHWHMRFATNTVNYYPSHILRDLIKTFDYVAKNCIKVETIKSIERCIEYMAGDKKSDDKKPAVEMDKIWRESVGVPAEVKYKSRQAM